MFERLPILAWPSSRCAGFKAPNRLSSPMSWPWRSRWRSAWATSWTVVARIAASRSQCAPPGKTASWPPVSCSPRGSSTPRSRWRASAPAAAPTRSGWIFRPGVGVDLDRLERHFYTSSSCGVCGKTSMAAVRVSLPEPTCPTTGPIVEASVIHQLPAALRAAQPAFERTGGLHASALFDAGGQLAGLARGRGPAQRPGQAHRRPVPRRSHAPVDGRASGQRPGELRAGAEGGGRRDSDPRGRRCTVEPGGRTWPASTA